jgi:hypothetical protein
VVDFIGLIYKVYTTFLRFKSLREFEAEPLKQNGLVFAGLGDAALADVNSVLCGKDDIDEAYALDLVQNFAGLIAESGLAAQLRKRFPKHVGQKTNKNVRLHALGLLVPDGPEPQIAFVNAKRRFSFGKLNVGAPEFFAGELLNVGPQQVAAFAEFTPRSPCVHFVPRKRCAAVGTWRNFSVKQTCRPAVLSHQSTYLAGDEKGILFACAAAFCDTFEPIADPFGESVVHGVFFEASLGATAQDERFSAVR